ncbi:LacI family DNA-binding transcriptional regulator [Alkalibacterium iburiense]|uniref:LacI family DNA-binding transcriptional regulator n=1 Tax=Alkalibacterium iburiense TaxID=290589 RepID=A0ABN0XIF4_9LACT
MSTLKEIATAAGVSVMTVSNVVNGRHHKVSVDTIDRINKLIEEMNYVPNASARILSTSRSKLIAMCINNKSNTNVLEDPYNSFIVGAVSRQANEKEYAVLLENETEVPKIMSQLKSWNVAGAIFLGFTGNDLLTIEKEMTVPYVCLDCYPESKNMVTIGTHDYNGGKLAGQYLTSLGHKRIAFASGPTITDKNSKQLNPLLHYRFQGFQDALKEEGLALQEEYILKSEITYDDGVQTGSHLALLKDVTAVFCTADILAAGVIEGLRLSGKKVPHEISVLGFDNLPISNYISPKLSTINQQHTLKGQSAVDYIVNMIESPEIVKPSIQYDVNLVERQTTLPIY